MADNKTLTSTVATVPSGTVLASDEIGGVDYPRGKIGLGDNGTAVDWVGGSGVVGTNTARVVLATDVALPAGTNAIGKLAANAGVTIGAVEIAAAQTLATVTTVSAVTAISNALPAGTNNIGDVDVLTLNSHAAHDAAVAGTPVLVSGVAQDTDDTAPPNRVNAESDVVRLATDRDGSLHVRPHGPQLWSYHVNGSAALTDATVHAAPGAGLSLYVTDIIVSSGAATAMNVFFEEGASTIMGPYYLEAVAGRGLALHFVTPRKITANTALTVTTSAAIAHAVDVTGYTAQG